MKIFFNPFGFISGMFFGTVPGCKKGYQSNGADFVWKIVRNQ